MRYLFFLLLLGTSALSAQLLPNGEYWDGSCSFTSRNDTLFWENEVPSYRISARTTRDTSSLEGRVLIHDTYRITIAYLEGGQVCDLRYIQKALKNLYVERYEFLEIEKDQAARDMMLLAQYGAAPTAGFYLERAGRRSMNSLLIAGLAIPIALVNPGLAAVIPAAVVINQIGVYKDFKRAGKMLQKQGI